MLGNASSEFVISPGKRGKRKGSRSWGTQILNQSNFNNNFNRDNILFQLAVFLPNYDMSVCCSLWFFAAWLIQVQVSPFLRFRRSQVRRHGLAWASFSVLMSLMALCGLHPTLFITKTIPAQCLLRGAPTQGSRGLISHWLLLDVFLIIKLNELLRKQLWHASKVPKIRAFYLPINTTSTFLVLEV